MKFYLDAGTTYSKIIEIINEKSFDLIPQNHLIKSENGKNYYILPSKVLKNFDIKFEKTCGHMGQGKTDNNNQESHENEIVALARGFEKYCKNKIDNATVLDMGSRDIKRIVFENGKFKDMDWNTSCASSTGATVEMLLKFYDVNTEDLSATKEKYPVTCGIFGLEKIMDDISKGIDAQTAISKFIHGIAYNAWNFAKKPQKIYLSGGFCNNECFVKSLENYCEVITLGRFILCEGLIEC